MTWKEFGKKVEPLLETHETIGSLGFKFGKDKYRITSQWGSGDKREFVNLWAKKIKDKDSNRLYPFTAEQVDKLKFYKI